jgi:chemotaxis protein histidine kinase CheA
MPTLSEYFDTEARDRLIEIERAVAKQPVADTAELHRAARALRGSARMARAELVFRAAAALEAATRALAATGLAWTDDIARRVQETVADLRALIERADDDAALEARAAAVVERWAAIGVTATAAQPAAGAAGMSAGAGEFREFAAREVAGIADALDRGVRELATNPMDREPLRMILRRQRALLGSARLDGIPVVAEILRAVEDLTRVIAKLDVGVKQEWLDIYRVARDGLRAAIEPLHRNEDPGPGHSLSRLRHMREELLERYGTGEAVSAAHESGGLVQAAAVQEVPEPPVLRGADTAVADQAASASITKDADDDIPPAAAAPAAPAAAPATAPAVPAAPVVPATAPAAPAVPAAAAHTVPAAHTAHTVPAVPAAPAVPVAPGAADADVVPIEELCYTAGAALDRAAELRPVIERAAAADQAVREAVDELFDLIRIART